MPKERAYNRLTVDERRRRLIDTGAKLFAEHAFEEISMRQIAQASGVSKALLYHYFPSKNHLFKAAVAEAAIDLQRAIAPSGEGSPFEQLTGSLDAYLRWIEANRQTWSKLMQSTTTLPEAGDLVEAFRAQTMDLLVTQLTGQREPAPALRIAMQGWLGFIDSAILDWTRGTDLSRDDLRDLLLTSFGASLLAAQQVDPSIELHLDHNEQ